MKIKISKNQWEQAGKNAGWISKEAGLGQGLKNLWQGVKNWQGDSAPLQDFREGLKGKNVVYGPGTKSTTYPNSAPYTASNISAPNVQPAQVLELYKQLVNALPPSLRGDVVIMMKKYEELVAQVQQQQGQQQQQPQQQPAQ